MLHFGFSYVGLIYLLMLFIPNMIWAKNQPQDYERYVQMESKVLQILERIGEVLVCCFVLIFSDFNVRLDSVWSLWLLVSFGLMLLYEYYWIQYFRSEKKMTDFYRSVWGIPVAGATLPVGAFFLLGVYGGNIFLIVATIILGIGHVGIHWNHYKAVREEKKKRVGLRMLWGILGTVLVVFFGLIILIIGARNVNYMKHFTGSGNGIDEEIFVHINGQEQYLLIKGEDVENPVMIYLHGGPAGPDGMASYVFTKYLTDSYTVVCWDQRGCGNTYYRNKGIDPENATATFEQALEDLDKLVDYVCERFDKSEVIIMGHSYGTVLGSEYVLEHPEKVSNYVGIGQFVSMKAAERVSYEDAYAAALEKQDKTIEMTIVYEKFMQDGSIQNLMNLRKLTTPYHQAPRARNVIWAGLASPYMSLDALKWQVIPMINLEGHFKLNQKLMDYTFEVNLLEKRMDYQVPVVFISGSCDWTTPVKCTKEYLEAIEAPDKSLKLLEDCGHSPHFDAPEEFCLVLREALE